MKISARSDVALFNTHGDIPIVYLDDTAGGSAAVGEPQRAGIHDVNAVTLFCKWDMGVSVQADSCIPLNCGLDYFCESRLDIIYVTMGEKDIISFSAQGSVKVGTGTACEVAVAQNADHPFFRKTVANAFQIVETIAQMDNKIRVRMALDHIVQCAPPTMGIRNYKYLHIW